MKLKGLRKLACMAMVTTFLVTSAAQLGTVYATDASAPAAIVEVAEETGASPVVEEDPSTEATTEAPDDTIAIDKKTVDFSLDVNDPIGKACTVTVENAATVTGTKGTYLSTDASGAKAWTLATDKEGKTAADGITVKATVASSKVKLELTIDSSKVFAKSGSNSYYLAYDGKAVSTTAIKITRKPDSFVTSTEGSTGRTLIEIDPKTKMGALSYSGTNTNLVVNSKYGSTKVDTIKSIGGNVNNNVVVLDGITTIKANAIDSTKVKKLVLPDSITTVEPGAIKGTSPTLKIICSDRVKGLFGSTTGVTFESPTTNAAKAAQGDADVKIDLEDMTITGGDTDGKISSVELDATKVAKSVLAENAEKKAIAADIQWMVCKPGTLMKSSAAKIKKEDEKGKLAATLEGLKAKGDFNEKVDIVALSQSTGKVYARATLYITPEIATKWKEDAKYAEDKVTVEEGKTSKIPYALADGKDKTLVYEIGIPSGTPAGSSVDCISITNGTIKGIKPGICEVTVKALRGASTLADKKITVEVKAKTAKATKASVSAITLKKGSTEAQEFTVFADTLTTALGDVTVEIANKSTNLDIKYQDERGAWQPLPAGGKISFGDSRNIGVITVASKDGTAVNDTIVLKSGSLKEAKIKVSTKDALVNPAKFSQPSSKKDIDIPVGTTRKLGLSLPANGICDYKVFVKDTDPTGNGYDTNGLTAIGDILTAAEAGTYKVHAVSKATRNAKVYIPGDLFTTITDKSNKDLKGQYVELPIPCAVSDEFIVNVYDPASTFVFRAKASNTIESIVKGGYLIKGSEADWDCNKSFKTGTSTTLDYPLLGSGDEEIIWTVSKPGAVTITEDKKSTPKKLTLNFNAAGKYTVTGTTKYSKMKTKFTVQVDAPTLDEWKASKVSSGEAEKAKVRAIKIDAKDATAFEVLTGNKITGLSKGDTVTLGLFLDGVANAGGKVTFKSSDDKMVTVTNAGVVKLKENCEDVKITMTLVPDVKTGATETDKVEVVVTLNPKATS